MSLLPLGPGFCVGALGLRSPGTGQLRAGSSFTQGCALTGGELWFLPLGR